MIEQERNEFEEWLCSPQSELPLALEMIRVCNDGGQYFDVPESNGFPANRFAGRLLGYMYALTDDRIKPDCVFRINMETIRPYASQEEIEALVKLQEKIRTQADKKIPPFDDGYVGRLEGLAIYHDKEDLSLLYSEKDVDLNGGRDADGIPSYAYRRSHLKAGFLLGRCNKSRDDVIETLKNDGLSEKGAAMVADKMMEVIRQQRKKTAIKSLAFGLLFFLVGALIAVYAVTNGGVGFGIAVGFVVLSFLWLPSGVSNYIKALRHKD